MQKGESCMEQTTRPAGLKLAWALFWNFAKIGAFTFGSGWSIIAQMEQEYVDKRGWVRKDELLELIAVGKSLPGIMVANITMLFGYQLGGALGGVCAAVGLSLPAVVVMTVVTAIYDLLKSNYWVFAALQGVQCAVVPIIATAAISLGREALRSKPAVVICLGALALNLFTPLSGLTLVVCGAVLGLIWMGVSSHD